MLQVVIVLLLVVSAVVAQVLQVRRDSTQEARNRSVAVAETFANAPGTVAALHSPDPTAILQPRAEAARKASKVDFIVVLNTDGIRYTHPKPDRIGKKFVGDIAPALAGHVVTEELTGTIGPLVQAVVPVRGTGGAVVGLVSAKRDEGERRRHRRPAAAAPADRRGSGTAPRHRRHGPGQQTPATPDARPGPARDDPDVRAPRRGAARRTRGRDHRQRRGLSCCSPTTRRASCSTCPRTPRDSLSRTSDSTPT